MLSALKWDSPQRRSTVAFVVFCAHVSTLIFVFLHMECHCVTMSHSVILHQRWVVQICYCKYATIPTILHSHYLLMSF